MFFRGGGVRTPCPPSGSAHGTGHCIHLLRYTENPFYRALRLLYDTAYFLSHAQILKLTKHSFLNTRIQNRFCKCKFREKERETGTCTSFRENQRASTYRQEREEREICVLFEFHHFLSTYFKVSCISLQKILIDEMPLYYIINGICADGEQANESEMTIHR